MSADATTGTFPWESAVVYKTDVRGIFRVFFWPMSPAKSARNVSTRKKGKRRRKSTKRTDEGTRCLVASSERTQGDKPDVLINDHPAVATRMQMKVSVLLQIVRVKVSVLLSLSWQSLMMWCMKSREVNLV